MYSMPLFRPPSEARSLIIQITEGCSHNKCRFCYSFKEKPFRLKSNEEIQDHVRWLKAHYGTKPEKIFLADGNALCLKTEKIIELLKYIKKEFPNVRRISSYGGPLDLLRKTPEELKLIRDSGLDMLYMGVESGSDKVLSLMNKGVNAQEMIEAGQKAVNAGFIFSCMVISGLGGTEYLEDHALGTAKVISGIKPHYFSLLRLVVEEQSALAADVKSGKFKLLTPLQVLDESIIMLENMELENTVFRANHVSNYVNQAGVLNQDRDALVSRLKAFRASDNFVPGGFDRL